MAVKHVVDTHAIVWFLEGNPRLGDAARDILNDSDSELIVPVIVLAEACWIIERGRTGIPTVRDFLDVVDSDPRLTIAPLDRVVLDKTLSLTDVDEMHDRQIIATALLLMDAGESVVLLTKDSQIQEVGQVPVVW